MYVRQDGRRSVVLRATYTLFDLSRLMVAYPPSLPQPDAPRLSAIPSVHTPQVPVLLECDTR